MLEPTGTHSASFHDYEDRLNADERATEALGAEYGAEIKALSQWLNACPEGWDIEAIAETAMQGVDADGDDYRTLYDWLVSWSPRLQDAIKARGRG